MFRCDKCGEVTEAKEPMTKVVTEKRERTYPPNSPDDNAGAGWEIGKEEAWCLDCSGEKK